MGVEGIDALLSLIGAKCGYFIKTDGSDTKMIMWAGLAIDADMKNLTCVLRNQDIPNEYVDKVSDVLSSLIVSLRNRKNGRADLLKIIEVIISRLEAIVAGLKDQQCPAKQ